MKLIAVTTEKSLKLVKKNGFTFWVPRNLTKFEIKDLISETYGVHVTEVKTLNYKAGIKKNNRGKVIKIKARKKAIVFLKEGEKIELFEEEKKKAKKKVSKKKS